MTASVSVLVPMYNHAHYIGATLRSVLQQTHTDFECIVMDDGSTDDGAKIVAEFAAKDRRIRLLQQPNGGLVAALNALAAVAEGEFVTTLDADDCFLPERLADGVADLRANPALSVSFCGVETIDAQGQRTEARLEILRAPLEGEAFYTRLVCSNFLASCAGMIRRERLAAVGPFARPMGLIPDWDLWLRLAVHGELALREKVGVQVRWDGQNMSSRRLTESALQHIRVSQELTERVCKRHNLGRSVRASICDMRIGWSRCINNQPEALRALSEKRRYASLTENDWALLVHVLICMKRFDQAVYFLRELSAGRFAKEVSEESRTRFAASHARLAGLQASRTVA